jgi:hypothetical protein
MPITFFLSDKKGGLYETYTNKKIILLLMILFSVSMQTSAENTDGIDKTKPGVYH